jgi:hypothetical protein
VPEHIVARTGAKLTFSPSEPRYTTTAAGGGAAAAWASSSWRRARSRSFTSANLTLRCGGRAARMGESLGRVANLIQIWSILGALLRRRG